MRSFLKPPEEGKASGFAMVLYETSTGLIPAKIGGPFTAGFRPGDWFVAKGDWRESMHRGRPEETFRAFSIRPDLPSTPQGVQELIVRTFDKEHHGIETAAVEAFVRRHGGEVARRIEREPRLLLEMCTDPARFAGAILRDWGRRNSGRIAISLMDASGFSPRAVETVIEAFRDDAISVIRANPYQFIGMSDVTFDQTDALGRQVGIASDDPRRITAAVEDAISTVSSGSGHTFTPLNEMSEILRGRGIEPQALRSMIQTGRGAAGEGRVSFDLVDGLAIAQHAPLADAERAISVGVSRMVARGLPDDRREWIERVTRDVLSRDKFARFDDIQRAAVVTSATGSFAILTGGPGTGKSTVTEAIAEIAAATSPGPVILLAPTGKAASRLAETTGRQTSTVHTGLKARFEGGRFVFGRNGDNPFPAGCFVVVDEASMLDVETTAALIAAMPPDGRLLLVGDRFQLPSVGAGFVLGDLLSARAANGMAVPSSELINVYRSDRNGSIAKGAVMIKNGEVPMLDNKVRGGLVLFEHKTPMIVDRISGLVRGAIQRQLHLDPMKDVGILSPQAPGPAGTWELNQRMSAELNPSGARIDGIARGPADDPRMPLPRIGDRVMLTRNDPDQEVMNGDVGTLVDAFSARGPGGRDRRMLKVAFDSGRIVDFPLTRWRELIPAYAITGHKSQGSQYPLVIMPLTMAHARMLERTLIYTQWTRAQDYLMLVGEREALELAVETVTATQRRTRLRGLLEQAFMNLAPGPRATSSSAPRRPTRSIGLRAAPRPQEIESAPAPSP